MPRHQFATVHELARTGLLAGIPGETLGKLAERMERLSLDPGQTIMEAAAPGSFYVVLSGMLSAGGVKRPGDTFGGEQPFCEARAMMPTTVAACDRDTFETFVAPLLRG
jgi:CRP-like cAMP-binding protein